MLHIATTTTTMTTNKKSRRHSAAASSSNALPWKKVDTATLPESSLPNHYDDTRTCNGKQHSSSSPSELEASPQESVAMFFGLEVISGDDYVVNGHGKLEMKESSGRGDDTKKRAEPLDEKQTEAQRARKKQKAESNDEPAGAASNDLATIKSKKKKKKKRSKKTANQAFEEGQYAKEAEGAKEHNTTAYKDASSLDEHVQRMQMSWIMATGGVELHPTLCLALLKQQFWTPTPIQAATLPASILGRRNVVGAAPTGSGKTLAYLLPILQTILSLEQHERVLQALILTPTRELALQVHRECDLLSGDAKTCATIVGGLALAKQQRILEKNKPLILAATPGRLWELMSSGEHEHLTNLSQLRFLVIDEADRMIRQGSFPQLVHIFEVIHQANPLDIDVEGSDSDDDENDQQDRLQSLPGIPGEAKVEMLGDVLERMRQEQGGSERPPQALEMDDDEFEEMQMQQHEKYDDDVSLPAAPPVQRQTFVYSATMTLPPSASYVAKATKNNKKKGKAKKAVTVDGAIAEILEKARAHGLTKVVDLTSSDKRHVLSPSIREQATIVAASSEIKPSSSSRLPPGLTLYKIECTQLHKDSHLYAYLVTTAQGASGPCLVFCNSIASVRRVGATLQALRLPVRMLHANMAQKARFKAVESLREPRSIVVATDVAARGLDIPSVATVVHYDVARQVDTFIHRAGRTARGMGKDAVGASLSLIASGEDKAHNRVCEALNSKHLFREVNMDGRLLAAAQERANLAAKVVECDEVETKTRKSNKWFQEAAEEAGLDLDDDMLDEGLAGGDRRDQHKLREAKAARARLRQLLAQPMQTQRFGKFLCSNSAAAEQEVAAYVVPLTNDHKKKKRQAKVIERKT